ncbi:sialidase family protein [Mangrovibacterium diazotrophicum]|uniref:Putative neuraminidase n=1 Tax=Mangrovibacterium diazotrophicum TaxID=1261403 RepID=A0A419W4H8_9BACT|nr:sialidase family protein [Mangrovibacterium diazotrophicum]RKD90364.1 putative neuraminidase [Mangrovibacterium diazotrophicum]
MNVKEISFIRRQKAFQTKNSLFSFGQFGLFILMLLNAVNGLSASKPQQKDSIQSDFIFPLQGKHVHSSCLTELPNGDLLACWFEGSGERHANDVVINGARLKKGETAWSKPFLLADTPGNPDCNPILFVDHQNRLHLIWLVVVANRWETSILKTRISTDYLKDGAPNWSWQDIILLQPGNEFATTVEAKFKELKSPELAWAEYAPQYEKMIVEAAQDPIKRQLGWMGRIKPLLLDNDRILLPLYSDGFNLSLVAISDDSGDNWKASLPIVGRGNIQPTLLQKQNGEIVAYMRDNGDAPGQIFTATSNDNGNSWTAASKTDIPNPGSSVDALALTDGSWLMICNDLEQGRNRLSLYRSANEGENWTKVYTLENLQDKKGGFSYPSIIQTKDGSVQISYSYSVEGSNTIKHVCIPPNLLTNNKK